MLLVVAESVGESVAALLDGTRLLAVVGYDANGTYGHPDHLQGNRSAHAPCPARRGHPARNI